MKSVKNFLILVLLIGNLSVEAKETGTLLLKSIVLPQISVNMMRTNSNEYQSVIRFVAKSNTYQFKNDHQIEVENPLGLDLKTEVIKTNQKFAQKEFRVIVGKESGRKSKNPFFIVKISAN